MEQLKLFDKSKQYRFNYDAYTLDCFEKTVKPLPWAKPVDKCIVKFNDNGNDLNYCRHGFIRHKFCVIPEWCEEVTK